MSTTDVPLEIATTHVCSCQKKYTTGKNAVEGSVYNPDIFKWELHGATWWWDYDLKDAEAALKTRPPGSTVTDKNLLAPSLRKAAALVLSVRDTGAVGFQSAARQTDRACSRHGQCFGCSQQV